MTFTIFNNKKKLMLNNNQTFIIYFMSSMKNISQFVFKLEKNNNIKRYLLMLLF